MALDTKRAAYIAARNDAARLAAAKLRRLRELAQLASEAPPDTADEDRERADAWVQKGVTNLAKAAGPDHVVLIAATCAGAKAQKARVGVGTSIRCEALEAMSALGRLVVAVNRSILADGVAARVQLRVEEIPATEVQVVNNPPPGSPASPGFSRASPPSSQPPTQRTIRKRGRR